ncbi:hypothetical protein NX059_001408 [Plenodomus lindquistii]|nr:hypothetical protein NX059_001408 [Plenodomus lindquistii]
MGFVELPLEILIQVLGYAVETRTVRRALRLRLVCKFFSREVLPIIYGSRALEEYLNQRGYLYSYGGSQVGKLFLQDYRTYQVMLRKGHPDKTPLEYSPENQCHKARCVHYYNDYRQIYIVATSLCRLAGDKRLSVLREYVHALCSPCDAVWAPRHMHLFPLQTRESLLTDTVADMPLDAAILLLQAALMNDCSSVVDTILEGPQGDAILQHGSDRTETWPSVIALAAAYGHRDILERAFTCYNSIPANVLQQALHGAIRSGSREMIKFVLGFCEGRRPPKAMVNHVWVSSAQGVTKSQQADFALWLYKLRDRWNGGSSLGHMLTIAAQETPQRLDVFESVLDRLAVSKKGIKMGEWGNIFRSSVLAGSEKIVHLLLERGIVDKCSKGPHLDQKELLESAARQGRSDIYKMLAASFPLAKKKGWGIKVLHLARESENEHLYFFIVAQLMENNRDRRTKRPVPELDVETMNRFWQESKGATRENYYVPRWKSTGRALFSLRPVVELPVRTHRFNVGELCMQ